ncbi:MAG: hypothetical protein AAF944_11350 [Bacteroidota bacterium]
MPKVHICVTLWIILIIMMILHFNYHVGEIFYGIDIVRPEAEGVVPLPTHLIRIVFQQLPVIWVILLIYTDGRPVKLGLLLISLLYTLAHAAHLVGELQEPDVSQTSLLSITLIASTILSVEHYRLYQECAR